MDAIVHRSQSFLVLLFLTAASFQALAAGAADWLRYRGPGGGGVSAEVGLARAWPEDGPPVVWRRPLGEGFSAVAVADGRLFTLFAEGEREFAVAFRAAGGQEVWRRDVGEKFVDSWGSGPRSTPVVNGDLVYALGSEGHLYAFGAADGREVWHVHLATTFGDTRLFAPRPGMRPENSEESDFWGHCSSLLVEGDLLIVYTGAGDGKSLAALDKKSGTTRWTLLDHPQSLSSPITVEIASERHIVITMNHEIVAVSPRGEVLWRHPWARFNIALPVFLPPNRLFFSSPNDVGAAVLEIRGRDGEYEVAEVWREARMRNNWQSSLVYKGSIVGYDRATLKSLSTAGELQWARRGLGKGTVIAADGLLILLSDQGLLTLAEGDSEEFRERGSVQVLEGPSWTAPSLAGGKLYLRNHEDLVSLDLAAAPSRSDSTTP